MTAVFKIVWLGVCSLSLYLNSIITSNIDGGYIYFFSSVLVSVATFIVPISLITLIELLDHKNFLKVRKTFLRGLYNWTLYFCASFFFLKINSDVVVFLGTHFNFTPLIDLTKANWHGLELLLFVFIVDFLYYIFHRLQHTIPFLWRFHEFHHAIEELNASNSAMHWSEEFWKMFFVTAPLALLVIGSTNQYLGLSGFLAFWGFYIHTDARSVALPYFLRFIIADNVYHHAHHGLAKKYHNKNFAAFFPFWDIIFRTSIMENDLKLPKVGVPGKSLPCYLGMIKLKVEKK